MSLILPEPHDTQQPAPDILTTLVMNYIWRRHIAQALTSYFEQCLSRDFTNPDVVQTWNNFHHLLEDLYDSEHGLDILRFCSIHPEFGAVYTASIFSPVIFDISQTPFYYDPDGMAEPLAGRFTALEQGIYLFVFNFTAAELNVDYALVLGKVGIGEGYDSENKHVIGFVADAGHLFGMMKLEPGEQIDVQILPHGTNITCQNGLAAFVRLGGL